MRNDREGRGRVEASLAEISKKIMMPKLTNDEFHVYNASQVAQNRYAYVILSAYEIDSRPYAEAFIILQNVDPIRGTMTFDLCRVPRDKGPFDEDATVLSEIGSARGRAEDYLATLRFDAFKAGNAAQSKVANDLREDRLEIRRLRNGGLPDRIVLDIRQETKSKKLRMHLNEILQIRPPYEGI